VLGDDVELTVGDYADSASVAAALDGIDRIFLPPHIGTSDQPLPGPATTTLRPPPAVVKNPITKTG
jgi:uncharacterized protein YbjT (DUF2867 family)